jgi:hypothetical protein
MAKVGGSLSVLLNNVSVSFSMVKQPKKRLDCWEGNREAITLLES